MKFPSNLIVFEEIFKTVHYCKCHLVTVSYNLMDFNIRYVAQFNLERRIITYICIKTYCKLEHG